MKMLLQFRHLGLQKRIMLYVTIGMALMFGSFTFVGLRYVQQATELVYKERLTTAYTTVSIIERDFEHVAGNVDGAFAESSPQDAEQLKVTAHNLLKHLSQTDLFPFFRVTGIWVLTPDGVVKAVAGEPEVSSSEQPTQVVSSVANIGESRFVVVPSVSSISGGIPFGTIVARVTDPKSSAIVLLVAVHTVSVNSRVPYKPARPAPDVTSVVAQQDRHEAEYHLEVIDPNGLTVLGIGKDETPGEVSHHFSRVKDLMAQRKAGTFLHTPSPGDTFEPHVMAVVPLGPSPFYVMMEQPVDVALALPIQLRQRVILLAILGFIGTLLVAWITTRHVVRPTERLKSAAERMAQGDLGNVIEVSAQDEVGKLAESLEVMRQRLLAAYQQIQNNNKELELQVSDEPSCLLKQTRGNALCA